MTASGAESETEVRIDDREVQSVSIAGIVRSIVAMRFIVPRPPVMVAVTMVPFDIMTVPVMTGMTSVMMAVML